MHDKFCITCCINHQPISVISYSIVLLVRNDMDVGRVKITKVQSESVNQEGQTTQWPKDIKGVIRIGKSRRTDNTMVKRY